MQEHLYVKGFDAWWMDASEPDILSNADMDYRKQLMHPTALGASALHFNAYGLMNAKGIYEGQRSVNDSSRVFILTRSGYAGSQRFAAAVWSGDIGTRWEDMKAQISAGQNFSISGNPYWTMDNGGFCVEKRYERAREGSDDLEEWRELNARWHQFGAFVPLFRSHGQYPYREIWNIAPEGHPAYQTMKYYSELRYRLLPYIYTMAGRCYLDDYTIMRPLMMDFANDDRVMNIGDQYMFGSHLMVCPVYEYQARRRLVYFPQNAGWYDLYSGKYYPGGQESPVEAPYERMPVFVPAGSILPTGKPIQHSGEKQETLRFYVFSGQDGKACLYEDDATSYDYEKGDYARITFHYNDAQKVCRFQLSRVPIVPSRLKGGLNSFWSVPNLLPAWTPKSQKQPAWCIRGKRQSLISTIDRPVKRFCHWTFTIVRIFTNIKSNRYPDWSHTKFSFFVRTAPTAQVFDFFNFTILK